MEENEKEAEEIGAGYPGYQWFKMDAGNNIQDYCSAYKVKSHAVGAKWVADCLRNFNLQVDNMRGTPKISDSIVQGAIIYDNR